VPGEKPPKEGKHGGKERNETRDAVLERGDDPILSLNREDLSTTNISTEKRSSRE